MMHIPTYVTASTIHGLGLFTMSNIKKDTLLWSFAENFDRRYTREEFNGLHPAIQAFYKIYGYQDIHDGLYYMTIDNDRFTNHSDTPNTYFDKRGNWYALQTIHQDEELTANYREFDAEWETYLPAMIKENKDAKVAA